MDDDLAKRQQESFEEFKKSVDKMNEILKKTQEHIQNEVEKLKGIVEELNRRKDNLE